MGLFLVTGCLIIVILMYFFNNPLKHSSKFMWKRFFTWFPLGMSYAFLYMARYNLNVSKTALGSLMSNQDFGTIFFWGATAYATSFVLNGPLVDRMGGKKGILVATVGSALMNLLMGLVTYFYMIGELKSHVVLIYSLIYSVGMFFQSFGGVSIIKIKAYWFHVRERGVFGAIFGTLISVGMYFAFDWGDVVAQSAKLHPDRPLNAIQSFIRSAFFVETHQIDSVWLIFVVPAILLLFWAFVDLLVLKDSPLHAKFADFDTGCTPANQQPDDSSSILSILKTIFSNPIIYVIAAIDFSSGAIRNGIINWFPTFAQHAQTKNLEFYNGLSFFKENWGLILCLTGIFGGVSSGFISDHIFKSRRGPPTAINNILLLIFITIMGVSIFNSPIIFGVSCTVIFLCGIGVHSLMSGTAAADFGGKKHSATAAGIVDGFSYLGSGVQSLAIGYLSVKSWTYWPMFLAPFALLGLFLAAKIWTALPEATKRYLLHVEKISLVVANNNEKISVETSHEISDVRI